MIALGHRLDGAPEAPVVVLSGSLGTDLTMWDPQVEPLSKRFRVLRYDLRGHGASAAPPGPYSIADLGQDLLALMDQLEIERASLCGVSIGGMLSMWVAADAPERVERLVVCCSSAFLDPEGTYRERAALVRAQGIEPIADAVIQRWFTPAFAAANAPLVERMRAVLCATPPEGYAGCCEALAAMDLRPELAKISAPTLVISGEDDPATPPAHGRAIAGGVRGAEFIAVANAAHIASIERAELVTALILRFLQPDRLGMRTRREILGDAHVDRATAAAGNFGAPFQEFITDYAWGGPWSRPGLDRRTRSAITLAALVTLRAENEIGMHVRAALRNGLSADEIREILLHTAVYAGVPAANAAFAVAQRVLREEGAVE